VTGKTDGCDGHAGLAEELRVLALTLLDRIEPVLDQVRSEPAGSPDASAPYAAACAVCPICAVIAVLRGERSELAARLAEQVGDLVTALRAALEEGGAEQAPPDPAAPPSGRRVQRIPVERVTR
jgi:hypothetical protein